MSEEPTPAPSSPTPENEVRPPSLWLRLRVVPPPYEPPKKIEMPPGSRYQSTYSSFGISDMVCEVMLDNEVVGVLPNFQGFQVNCSIGDITQDIVLHMLCTKTPFASKNEIQVR